MTLSGESHQSGFVLELHLAPCGLRYAMPYALCALRYFEVTMPAIASLEDLKAAQEDLMEAENLEELKGAFKSGEELVGKTSVSYGFRSGHQNN